MDKNLLPSTPDALQSSQVVEVPQPPAEHADERYQQLFTALGEMTLHSANEQLTEQQIVDDWEQHHAVKQPPRFAEQAMDTSRQSPFRYAPSAMAERGVGSIAMEQEALLEVREVLTNYIGRNANQETGLVGKAVDILQNLTFIGEKEYQEAATGIGTAWKAYLDEYPDSQLCVITEINQLERFDGKRKSDEHLKQQILETFTDEELERYSGRIVDQLQHLTVDAEHGKIVMLDDWTISGKQMVDSYQRLLRDPVFLRFAARDRVEINLIAASADRIRNGLPVPIGEGEKIEHLPVFAYYQAHYAATAQEVGFSYITGLHSSVNYGFGRTCEKLTPRSAWNAGHPMLANVVRDYRTGVATVDIQQDRLQRLPEEVVARNKAIVLAGGVAASSTTGGEAAWQ